MSQLNTWSNNREFCDVQDEERDWLDVFGISDYDALALAQGKKASYSYRRSNDTVINNTGE